MRRISDLTQSIHWLTLNEVCLRILQVYCSLVLRRSRETPFHYRSWSNLFLVGMSLKRGVSDSRDFTNVLYSSLLGEIRIIRIGPRHGTMVKGIRIGLSTVIRPSHDLRRGRRAVYQRQELKLVQRDSERSSLSSRPNAPSWLPFKIGFRPIHTNQNLFRNRFHIPKSTAYTIYPPVELEQYA